MILINLIHIFFCSFAVSCRSNRDISLQKEIVSGLNTNSYGEYMQIEAAVIGNYWLCKIKSFQMWTLVLVGVQPTITVYPHQVVTDECICIRHRLLNKIWDLNMMNGNLNVKDCWFKGTWNPLISKLSTI